MEKKLNVDGMSCMHCHGRVTKLLEATTGISNVNVSLEQKEAVFQCESHVDLDQVISGITELGFTASEK